MTAQPPPRSTLSSKAGLWVLALWMTLAGPFGIRSVDADEPEPPTPSLPEYGGTAPTPVGSFEGALSVDASGSASYVMALDLPDAGSVTPNINLVYNSSAPNGVLGVGWSVQAASSIESCRHLTVHRHAERKKKGLCLDGRPLVRVAESDLVPGAAPQQYRTSPDTQLLIEWRPVQGELFSEEIFSKVALGYDELHTADWSVRTPDGWRHLYKRRGSRSLLWYSLDPSGNYVRYTYHRSTWPQNVDPGAPVALANIQYGRHFTGNHIRPTVQVDFRYKTGRPDPVYYTGQRARVDVLLEEIDVSTADENYRLYRFNYREPDGGGLSTLHSVEECVARRSQVYCKPRTKFEYQTPTPGFEPAVELGTHSGVPCNGPFAVELSRDGRDDLLWGDCSGDDSDYQTALVSHAGNVEGLTPGQHVNRYQYARHPSSPWTPATITNQYETGGFHFESFHDHENPRLWTEFGSNGLFYAGDRGNYIPAEVGETLLYVAIDLDEDGLTDIITCSDPTLTSGADVGYLWFWRNQDQGFFAPPQAIGGRWGVEGNNEYPRLACARGELRGFLRSHLDPDAPHVTAQHVMPLLASDPSPSFDDVLANNWGTIIYYDHMAHRAHGAMGKSQTASAEPRDIRVQVNPDGRPNWLSWRSIGGNQWRAYLSIGLANAIPLSNLIHYHAEFRRAVPIDYNGDGYDDILFPRLTPKIIGGYICCDAPNEYRACCATSEHHLPTRTVEWEGTWHIAVWDPSADDFYVTDLGIPASEKYEYHGSNHPKKNKYVASVAPITGDFNGDERTDLILSQNETWQLYTRRGATYENADAAGGDYLLREIQTGTGRRHSIEYRRMNDIAAPYVSPDTGVYVPWGWNFSSQLPSDHERTDCPMSGEWSPHLFSGAVSRCITTGRPLVSTIQEHYGSDGGGRVTTYSYEDARTDPLSREWLGFGRVTERITTGQQNVVKHSFFHNSKHNYGALSANIGVTSSLLGAPPDRGHLWANVPYRQLTLMDQPGARDGAVDIRMNWDLIPTVLGGQQMALHETTQHTYQAPAGSFAASGYHPNVISGLDPITASSIAITEHDSYGNPLGYISQAGGEQTEVHRTFNVDLERWLLRRIESEVVLLSDGRTRTQTLEYEDPPGLPDGVLHGARVKKRTLQPDEDSTQKLTISYEHNANGTISRISQRDNSLIVEERVTEIEGSSPWPWRITNAEGHETRYWYDPVLGLPLVIRDPFGVETHFEYDAFGRPIAQRLVSRSGTKEIAAASFAYEAADAGWPAVSRVRVREINSAGAASETLFGEHGRAIEQIWDVHSNPGSARRYWQYDLLGRLTFESTPAFTGVPNNKGTLYRYDASGRLLSRTNPDGAETKWTYEGLQTRVHDAEDNPPWIIEHDAAGHISKVTDALGTAFCYSYDGNGLLQTLHKGCQSGQSEEVVTQEYDVLGRRTAMHDPARGSWEWRYDAFGQLRRVTDGEGQVRHLRYDRLGRITADISLDGERSFTYDLLPPTFEPPADWTGGHVVHGKLVAVAFGENNSRQLEYDDFGRLSQTITSMPFRAFQGTEANQEFATEREYDQHGRLQTLIYPEPGDGTPGIILQHNYAPSGELLSLSSDSQVLWQLGATDASGRPIYEVQGNGVVSVYDYDATGRPRTIEAGFLSPGGHWLNKLIDHRYDYTLNGNVHQRTDHLQQVVETFEYDHLDRLISATSNATALPPGSHPTWQLDAYGNMFHHSHVGGLPSEPNGRLISVAGDPVSYDDNGSLVAIGDFVSIDWWASGKPARVQRGNTETFLDYGVLGELTHREDTDWGSTKEVWFIDGLVRVEDELLGQRRVESYIFANGQVVATRVAVEDDTGISSEFLYSHYDRLGSQNMVTSAQGAVQQDSSRSFGPWGELRGLYWTNPGATAGEGGPDIGFTGHRFLQDGGLVDMGARHYDPETRRFISPDPVVPGRYDTQAWNAYAYARSNPTTLIDPTGLFPCDIGMCKGVAGTVLEPGLFGVFEWAMDFIWSAPSESTAAGTAKPFSYYENQAQQDLETRKQSAQWKASYGYMSEESVDPTGAVKNQSAVIDARGGFFHAVASDMTVHAFESMAGGGAAGACIGADYSCALANFGVERLHPDAETMAWVEATVVHGREAGVGGQAVNGALTVAEYAMYLQLGYAAGYGAAMLGSAAGRAFLNRWYRSYLLRESQRTAAKARTVAQAVPTITKGQSHEMLGQAIQHLKRMSGSAADKARAFEGMAAQINKLSGGSWSAARMTGADGAHIFVGEYGEALVISSTGALFRGNANKFGTEFAVGAGGKLQPIYSALKGL